MKPWKTLAVTAGLLTLAACGEPKPTGEASWISVGLGSVVETRTTTRLERLNVREAVATNRHTLLSKTADEASLAFQVDQGDGPSDAATLTVPLKAEQRKPEECPGMTVETAQETCAVPAGTFDCTKTTIQFQQGEVKRTVETWIAAGIPVPVRSVVRNEALTTITELTKLNLTR